LLSKEFIEDWLIPCFSKEERKSIVDAFFRSPVPVHVRFRALAAVLFNSSSQTTSRIAYDTSRLAEILPLLSRWIHRSIYKMIREALEDSYESNMPQWFEQTIQLLSSLPDRIANVTQGQSQNFPELVQDNSVCFSVTDFCNVIFRQLISDQVLLHGGQRKHHQSSHDEPPMALRLSSMLVYQLLVRYPPQASSALVSRIISWSKSSTSLHSPREQILTRLSRASNVLVSLISISPASLESVVWGLLVALASRKDPFTSTQMENQSRQSSSGSNTGMFTLYIKFLHH
jgi:hypothetical protein